MRSNPSDLALVALWVAGAVALWVAVSRPFSWYRSRTPRLRLLTGTRPQRVALAPVVREFLPLLDKTGRRCARLSWCPRSQEATRAIARGGRAGERRFHLGRTMPARPGLRAHRWPRPLPGHAARAHGQSLLEPNMSITRNHNGTTTLTSRPRFGTAENAAKQCSVNDCLARTLLERSWNAFAVGWRRVYGFAGNRGRRRHAGGSALSLRLCPGAGSSRHANKAGLGRARPYRRVPLGRAARCINTAHEEDS
jgi:hypothetical protein